jgi:hypothetical protein
MRSGDRRGSTELKTNMLQPSLSRSRSPSARSSRLQHSLRLICWDLGHRAEAEAVALRCQSVAFRTVQKWKFARRKTWHSTHTATTACWSFSTVQSPRIKHKTQRIHRLKQRALAVFPMTMLPLPFRPSFRSPQYKTHPRLRSTAKAYTQSRALLRIRVRRLCLR